MGSDRKDKLVRNQLMLRYFVLLCYCYSESIEVFCFALQANLSLNLKNQSILGSLNVLNAKLSLLEPSHLELLEARLSSVLQKVTKISEKKLDVQELERTLKV